VGCYDGYRKPIKSTQVNKVLSGEYRVQITKNGSIEVRVVYDVYHRHIFSKRLGDSETMRSREAGPTLDAIMNTLKISDKDTLILDLLRDGFSVLNTIAERFEIVERRRRQAQEEKLKKERAQARATRLKEKAAQLIEKEAASMLKKRQFCRKIDP